MSEIIKQSFLMIEVRNKNIFVCWAMKIYIYNTRVRYNINVGIYVVECQFTLYLVLHSTRLKC